MIANHNRLPSIIFLMPWPISASNIEKFGFEILKSKGFDIKVYDLTELINKEALLKNPVKSEIESDFIHKIYSYQILISEVKKTASNSIFIDFLLGLSDIDLKNEKVFRILKKYDAKYYVIAGGTLPARTRPIESAQLLKYMLQKFKKASNPKILVEYIIKKIIVFRRRHTNLYPIPEKIFAMDSKAVDGYIRMYNITKDSVVQIHSFDYDTYLTYIRNNNSESQKAKETCIFLDEAATHHPDYNILGIRPVNEDRYFHSMRKLFDVIEKETGLKVVIAAHPRSNYEEMPGVFGDRDIIKGKTVDLVANSSMVVMHSSTSASFPVLFNKPIMVVKTSDMIKMGNLNLTDTMAEALGLKAINIDGNDSLNSLSFNYKTWSNAKYEDYKFKYVKSKNVEDLTVWEIVAKTIRENS